MSDTSILSRLSSSRRAYGAPLLVASLRSTPQDFQVEEQLGFRADGTGEHWLMHVEKCGVNTQDVLRALQQVIAGRPTDIGYAGLKDRHAIARQWFSVRSPLTAGEITERLAEHDIGANCRILEAERHGRKLRIGAHAGNRFVITLREVRVHDDSPFRGEPPSELATTAGADPIDAWNRALERRMTKLGEQGFPNLLGPQRFGHEGRNIAKALHWFAGQGPRPRRSRQGLLLSAARSAIFNRVCLARLDAQNWSERMSGEPLMLAGSRSWFMPAAGDEQIEQRLRQADLHTSGPWWGRGETPASDHCAAFEAACLDGPDERLLCDGLASQRLDMTRRALRAFATDLHHDWVAYPSVLRLSFQLPTGVFATSLLRELGDCLDISSRSGEASA